MKFPFLKVALKLISLSVIAPIGASIKLVLDKRESSFLDNHNNLIIEEEKSEEVKDEKGVETETVNFEDLEKPSLIEIEKIIKEEKEEESLEESIPETPKIDDVGEKIEPQPQKEEEKEEIVSEKEEIKEPEEEKANIGLDDLLSDLIKAFESGSKEIGEKLLNTLQNKVFKLEEVTNNIKNTKP